MLFVVNSATGSRKYSVISAIYPVQWFALLYLFYMRCARVNIFLFTSLTTARYANEIDFTTANPKYYISKAAFNTNVKANDARESKQTVTTKRVNTNCKIKIQ